MNVPNHGPSIDAAWVVGDKELHDAGVVASTRQMEGSLSLLQIETIMCKFLKPYFMGRLSSYKKPIINPYVHCFEQLYLPHIFSAIASQSQWLHVHKQGARGDFQPEKI